MDSKRIYVASPLGFSEAGRFFMYEKLLPVLEMTGFEVIDPWKLTPQEKINAAASLPCGQERIDAWKLLNIEIARNNVKGIESSDGLLAVLDGSDTDSGTASEIGYAAALKKKVTAYRGDFRNSGDNEGATVNLQIEYFIINSGGSIITSLDDLEDELKRLFIF